MPKASIVIPKLREKYSSREVDSRTSGERRVRMMRGDTSNGRAWTVSHPAVPYVYA